MHVYAIDLGPDLLIVFIDDRWPVLCHRDQFYMATPSPNAKLEVK